MKQNRGFFAEDRFPLEERQQLLEGLRKGDEGALKIIFDRVAIQLAVYLSKRHSKIPFSEIEEIVADKFVKLYQYRDTFQNIAHVCGFLFRSSTNAIIDLLRLSKQWYKFIPVEYENGEESFEIPNIDNVDRKQNDELALYLISDAIKRLPKQRKKIMELTLYENKTPREVGGMLDIAYQSVLNERQKAIEQLKKWIMPTFERLAYG